MPCHQHLVNCAHSHSICTNLKKKKKQFLSACNINKGRKDQPNYQKAPFLPAGHAIVYVHQILVGSAMKGAAARSLTNLDTIPS